MRCVNPNKNKEPDNVSGGHVLHQLRCSGMMEALRLMHAGFPTRCPYEDLYDRYKDMMPRSIASLDSPSFCEILLMALGLDKADYQLGITKVFFRAGKLAFLRLGEGVMQHRRHGQPEHAVAEKLKPLVACAGIAPRCRAAVGEGACQQRAIGECVAEAGLQVLFRAALRCVHVHRHTVRTGLTGQSVRNRRLNRTVQGHFQNIQAEASSSTEKNRISARPTKFSNGT